MKDIVIRKMKEQDLAGVAGLYALFWNEDQDVETMKAQFGRLKNDDRYIFLCAERGGRVVGTILGIVCEEIYGQCRPFLVMEDLAVHEDHRKAKIGTMLVRELERLGRERGCSQIQFITEASRTGSVKFYESLGYDPDRQKGFKRKL